MKVVDRTSVQVYFDQVKTSIHVPPASGFDPDILDWILSNIDLDLVNPADPEHIEKIRVRLERAQRPMNDTDVKKHLEELLSRSALSNVEWDPVAARAHELDVFTGANSSFVVRDSPFLEVRNSDLTGLDARLFGPVGLFSQVVRLTRLTETRVHDGFSRWEPASIVLRQSAVLHGAAASGYADPFADQGDEKKLSWAGVLAHSLAHLMMVELSQECGYPLPSIRDRIYDLPDGRLAFLVYTADSDIMGTLGGLVEFGRGPKLERLVTRSLKNARWCSQDPVCIGREVNSEDRNGSCCHQCLFLPETSCERMNGYLDRASVVGSSERGISGIV